MAYCTNANVASEFKDITFSSSTIVTDTEVDAFIAQVDAMIDGKLGNKYTVPITGSGALLIVKMISIYLTAYRVQSILELKTGETDKETSARNKNKDSAEKMLEDIFSGKMKLTDATLSTSHDGVKGYTYSNDIEAAASVTTDMW